MRRLSGLSDDRADGAYQEVNQTVPAINGDL
jgi:hypothetical protein